MFLPADGSVYVTSALYYIVVSKNWLYLQIWALILCVISTIMMWFVPESP